MQIRFFSSSFLFVPSKAEIDSFKEIKVNFQTYPKLIISRLSYTLYSKHKPKIHNDMSMVNMVLLLD